MTNKPNDVRVSRELLESFAAYVANSPNMIMRSRAKELRALLAQPAEQQGAPVAYWADAYGNTIQANHKSHNLKVGGTPAMVVERYITPLYAQPATAKVVLPERLDLPHRDEFESADQHAAAVGEAKTWNACLDEVAKLNAPQ